MKKPPIVATRTPTIGIRVSGTSTITLLFRSSIMRPVNSGTELRQTPSPAIRYLISSVSTFGGEKIGA